MKATLQIQNQRLRRDLRAALLRSKDDFIKGVELGRDEAWKSKVDAGITEINSRIRASNQHQTSYTARQSANIGPYTVNEMDDELALLEGL